MNKFYQGSELMPNPPIAPKNMKGKAPAKEMPKAPKVKSYGEFKRVKIHTESEGV